jgi:phosphoenolpyruvate carboxykinase (ATP)
MYRHSLGPIENVNANPDFVTVDVPEWPGERRILVDTITGTTFVLGSDYYGEIKKSFLRQFMYSEKMKGNLGLHAGSKEVWAKSHKTGDIQRKGLLFFGLSGTGKTSLTCHEYGLDEDQGEYVRVRQDDVVSLHKDGFSGGSEPEGFYIKTEGLNPDDQKALFNAARCPITIYENVFVAEDGKVDFDDDTISKNGRAIAPVKEVMFTDGDIDMPSTNAVFFITRNPLAPPLARLTTEQGAAAFMLGESIKTSAADPNAKGESVRCVGTNPFIVGDLGEEGNRIYEIFKNNPEMEVYILNTGTLGYGGKSRKIKILETVSMIREVCRDGIEWKMDPHWKVEVPAKIEGIDLDLFDMTKYFDDKEIDTRLAEIRKQRQDWVNQFPNLNPEVKNAVY